jgi:hypothetical protein
MIEWNSVKDKLPKVNDMCLLYSDEHDRCVGPFSWSTFQDGSGGMWVDFFASPEAGAAYKPEEHISHWAIWNGPQP